MFIHTTPAVPSVMSGRPVPGAGLPPSEDGSHAARRDNGDDATVIIVDDNAALRQTMAAIFESHGLRVSSFADPRQVLARLDLPRPACLLMDVRLPGMSGLELAQRLRERGERIPVIFLTGFATVDMAVRAMKAGAEDFLAPIIHDGHRISAGRAVATGLTAIFETDCRRGWRLLFGARPAAPAAWFRALGR